MKEMCFCLIFRQIILTTFQKVSSPVIIIFFKELINKTKTLELAVHIGLSTPGFYIFYLAPFSYGIPSALGTTDRPTNKMSTIIVVIYGSMDRI